MESKILYYLILGCALFFCIILLISLFKDVKKDKVTVRQKITLISICITVILSCSGALYYLDDKTSSQDTPDASSSIIGQTSNTPSKSCLTKERQPEKFFSGELRVGIKGDIPQWSFGPAEAPLGFDIDLSKYIHRYLTNKYNYDFKLKYETLRFSERSQALEDGCVDIVIANYSMTKPRDEGKATGEPAVDFAGPYFMDTSGLTYNTDKLPANYNPITPFPKEICVTSKTTASDYINNCGGTTVPKANSIHECVDKFKDPKIDTVAGIITDRSILAAYASAYNWKYPPPITVYCKNNNNKPLNDEQYGIGLKDGSPEICKKLNEAIKAFLDDTSGWNLAYDENFKNTILINEKSDHNPLTKSVNISSEFCNAIK
jgi:glutamate transport system substrate-binding protein